MKRSWGTYRNRCMLLAVCALLLLTLVWRKRLSVSVAQWQSRSRAMEDLRRGASIGDELATLRARSVRLDASLGDLDRSTDAVWQEVLGEVARLSTLYGIQLTGVENEHVSTMDQNTLTLLPVSMKGRYGDLLRTANELQRTVPEAHVVSLRFHMERGDQGRPPELIMTLYLQKITHHA